MVQARTDAIALKAADADPISQLARVDRQNRALILATLYAAVVGTTALLAAALASGGTP